MERNPPINLDYFSQPKIIIKIIILFLLSICSNAVSFANTIFAESEIVEVTDINSLDTTDKAITNKTQASKVTQATKNYLPYLQVEGMRLFNAKSKAAVEVDLFAPIWQEPTNLIFTDLRTYDGSGKPFEGNLHLGYRHLSPEKNHLYGIYGSFDRKKTWLGNYFNQISVGGECWLTNWFIGVNIYKPIGNSKKDVVYSEQNDGLWLTKNKMHEEAVPGADAEVGYEFTKRLIGYAGGYYFNGKDIGTKYGPKARLTYDWSLDNGDRIFGIFDKVGLEMGIQHDRPLGTICYLSANVRVGWLLDKKSMLQGVSSHMVDPVRRDTNIITMTSDIKERTPSGLSVTTTQPSSQNKPPQPQSQDQSQSPPPPQNQQQPPVSEKVRVYDEGPVEQDSYSVLHDISPFLALERLLGS